MFLNKADFAFEGARHYPHQKQSFQAPWSTNTGRNSFLLGGYAIKLVLTVATPDPTSTPFGDKEIAL